PAGEGQLRHRLVAALGDGACAVGDALGALERVANGRMGLEALELLERREIRVLVVQMDHEADGDLIVLEMVEERTAAGRGAQRPAEGVLDEAGLVLFRRNLPEFLEADAEFLRLAAFAEIVFRDELLGERTADALADEDVFAQ